MQLVFVRVYAPLQAVFHRLSVLHGAGQALSQPTEQRGSHINPPTRSSAVVKSLLKFSQPVTLVLYELKLYTFREWAEPEVALPSLICMKTKGYTYPAFQ